MEAEGIEFKTGVEVGQDVKGEEILKENDAMLMALGSTWPRDLPIPGKEHPFSSHCFYAMSLDSIITIFLARLR